MADNKYEGSVYLFCYVDTLEEVMQVLCKKFGVGNDGKGNTLELHNGDIDLYVEVAALDMGEEAANFLGRQKGAVCGHFAEVETEAVDVKTNLLLTIDRARSCVAIVFSFDNNNVEQKLQMVCTPFFDSLSELCAVMMVRGNQDYIYWVDENGERKLILSEDGRSDLTKFLPRELPNEPIAKDIEPEQIERRTRSRKVLTEKGIYVPGFYPFIESSKEAQCRTPEEIAKRAIALMVVSLYSEALLGENMSVNEAWDFVSEFIERFDAKEFFSPEEWEYLHNPNSTEQERVGYSWQYENLFVCEWALGLKEPVDKKQGLAGLFSKKNKAENAEKRIELGFPDCICDVPLTVRLLKNYQSIAEILEHANPRSSEELLDACDLIFCLDWACVETRIHGLPAPAGMDGGVVMERHKTLNWLVGAYERADWDDVETNT